MNHALHVWIGDRHVARIDHEPQDDRWQLAYEPAWAHDPMAFPLSPALPLRQAGPHAAPALKRFIEHLLPEGRALDVAAAYNGLTNGNVYGLIRALGAETAGALRFTAEASLPVEAEEPPPREISSSELDERIAQRGQLPFTLWDGRVRMSMAGLQDKLLVYLDASADAGERMYLVEGRRLASTHLLKPDTGDGRTPHLAVNEHYCMSLARGMGLPAADVSLLRLTRPVLVVRRFDREVLSVDGQTRVSRRHIIDTCQACDMPVSFKYERNLGQSPEVAGIRDGVSFERLFRCAELTANKAAARLAMLRWALFQFLIGNSDAHGKNFSFFVRPGGYLEPADWYDLVSVLQYEGFDRELAMAYGDVFVHEAVTPFALADFATRCGIDRKLMRREGQRLAKLAGPVASRQAASGDYRADERAFVDGIATFVTRQAERLARLVAEAATIKAD